MNFKFAIFENLNGTTIASLNKKVVQVNDISNNRNKLKAFIDTIDIHRNTRSKLLGLLENALTVQQMYNVKIGVATLEKAPAIVAYDDNKAVIVGQFMKGTRPVYKAMLAEMRLNKAKDGDEFVSMKTGAFIEIKEKIEFKTEQKVNDIVDEMAELRKEIESLKKKNAELSKENSALRKEVKGEELSFDEELFIAMLHVSEPTKVEETETVETVTEKEIVSTVFSLNEPVDTVNEPTNVCNDQSNEEIEKSFTSVITENTLSARERRLVKIKQERLNKVLTDGETHANL